METPRLWYGIWIFIFVTKLKNSIIYMFVYNIFKIIIIWVLWHQGTIS